MGTNTVDEPLISVIMGVYYRKADTVFLKRSVQSILDQTYNNFEFLICDDGSSQEALTTLERLVRQDSRIKLVRGIQRTDLASKLNACLNRSNGVYIARMDDDDWSDPWRFAKQVHALANNRNIAFVGSNVALCRSGKNCGERLFYEFPEVKDFLMTQPFVHPALMFRKEALDAVGGYSESKKQILCEDYDLLLRLYASGFRGMNLQENLLQYSIPATAKGNRSMRHRWNESITRYERFRDLGLLPLAWPFVLKPLAVGLLPDRFLQEIKHQRERGHDRCGRKNTRY